MLTKGLLVDYLPLFLPLLNRQNRCPDSPSPHHLPCRTLFPTAVIWLECRIRELKGHHEALQYPVEVFCHAVARDKSCKTRIRNRLLLRRGPGGTQLPICGLFIQPQIKQ